MIYFAIISLLIFGVIFLVFLAVRSLRWLSIIQQKEYRFDRLLSFLKSESGEEELARIVPQLSEFSRTGLKRPRLTTRMMILTLIYVSMLLILFIFLISNWLTEPMTLAFWLLGIYVAVPLLVYLASLPTAMIAKVQIFLTLKKASEMVAASQPIIIGIGGSYGKTSTKIILSELLSQKFTVFFTPKSFNNAFSIAMSIVSGYRGEQIAVIEYGAYRQGEIESLTSWLPPQLAIITGFTEQHLSLFGSVENSVLAESELVAALSEGSQVFFNAADAGAEHIVTIGSQGKQLMKNTYGEQKIVSKPEIDDHGRLSFLYRKKQVQTNLVGLHYLQNIEGAIMVAEHLGVSKPQIARGLREFKPGQNFVKSYRQKAGYWVLDDSGTSNPEGFRAMLKLMPIFKDKRKVLVFPGIVDLGDKSTEIHCELADSANQVFDQVLYVGLDGLEYFADQLGEKLVFQKNSILSTIEELDNNCLLVLEGKIPGWLEEKL